MKDIVILANFCRDFSPTDNGRFMYLCRQLSKEHHVELITSSFSHILKKQRPPLVESLPFQITFLPEPGYQRNVSLQRFYSHWKWGLEVKRYLASRKKPDVLYAAVPSLDGPLAAARYCKKNKVKFIVDIQDLWPEAFQMILNIPLLFLPFKYQANAIYRMANRICAVSRTYANRALQVNSSCSDATVTYLGTDLSVLDQNASQYAAEMANMLPPKEGLWLGYCGTLGDSYDISCVLSALSILKARGVTPPVFIVMGDGPLEKLYRQKAAELGVNALFTGRLPYEKMCALLSMCDLAVNPIRGNAAQSIINKHGDYAACGLPVLSTQESPEYRELVETYQMGFNCQNHDPDDLANKLETLMKDEALRKEMGRNARRCAEERFDRRHSYQALMDVITK